MINDIGVILEVYLISLGLQLLVWPWISKWFKGLTDCGWALGRVLGLLSIGLPVWFVGHVLPVNTDVGITIVILLLVLTGLRSIRFRSTPRETSVSRRPPPGRNYILVEEGLFLFGLMGLSLIRGFQPDILGLEKFMDYGFIKQYLVSSGLPAKDMWLAGETINYYSFGHFLASVLIRIWGVGLGVGYNVMLGWILGTSLALSFSIIVNLGGGVIGGLMGSILTCLGGNSHAIWYILKNKGLAEYWYPDATRFIENTIHEFPGYSFVVSDLHGHVLGLPIVLAFILVLVEIQRRLQAAGLNGSHHANSTPGETSTTLRPSAGEKFFGIVLGVLLGVMMMTNTWDVAIYGLLLVVFGVIWLIRKSTTLRRRQGSAGQRPTQLRQRDVESDLLKLGIVIGVVAGVTALPWILNFKFFSDGVSLTNSRSPLWQMGVLWGGHIAITAIAIIVAFKSHFCAVPPRGRPPLYSGHPPGRNLTNCLVVSLGVTALLLLIIPEVVYVKDIYTSHQRANTMFKLTYQAFIMMSLLFGWVVGQLLTRCRPQPKAGRLLKVRNLKVTNCLSLGFLFILWSGLMLFPVQAFSSYYGEFKKYKGMNGLEWLRKDTDKWGMIDHLENNRDGNNMIEAVGDSYTELNSVSAFSGTPTVIGWRVHEWLWRGGYDVVRKREDIVRDFYESGDIKILEDFNVGWVVVGVDERKEYKVNESRVLELGEVVWSGDGGYLIKITD